MIVVEGDNKAYRFQATLRIGASGFSQTNCSGNWREKNETSWLEYHLLLWPGCGQALKLVPPRTNTSKIKKGTGFAISPFHETTLPTSVVMSALVAQTASPKRQLAYLQATARLFKKLLHRCCATGEIVLVLTAPGTNVPLRVQVPCSGRIPSYFLLPPHDEDFFAEFRDQWNQFAEATCPNL